MVWYQLHFMLQRHGHEEWCMTKSPVGFRWGGQIFPITTPQYKWVCSSRTIHAGYSELLLCLCKCIDATTTHTSYPQFLSSSVNSEKGYSSLYLEVSFNKLKDVDWQARDVPVSNFSVSVNISIMILSEFESNFSEIQLLYCTTLYQTNQTNTNSVLLNLRHGPWRTAWFWRKFSLSVVKCTLCQTGLTSVGQLTNHYSV